jgi:hypothetical protein
LNITSVVGIKWDKENHTKHGLHLNKKGKELLTNRLVMDIKDLFQKSQSTPIVMTGPAEENKVKLQMGKGTKRSRVSTSQSKGKQSNLVNSKDDQEKQNIKIDNDEADTGKNRIGPLMEECHSDEELQPGKQLKNLQSKRTRRPLAKKLDDFLW